jgi:hypothetical protein
MPSRSRFVALFLLSTALIMYEIAAMRMFAVSSWSNFGSLVISTALLGFGLAGTLLTFIAGRVERAPSVWLYGTATVFMPTLALAHILGQRIPFNPIFIGSDPTQFLWIGLYYVIYGVPFFFGALFIGIAFLAHEGRVHGLYFWNMLGSSAGGLAVIPLMYLLPPASLVIPVLVLAGGASLAAALSRDDVTGKWGISAGELGGTAAAFLLSVGLVMTVGVTKVSEYKPISYVKKYPDAVQVHHSWSPIGEQDVYASSSLHFAPGLSDNAVLSLKTMPRQPFWAMYNDGNGPVGIMGALRDEEAAYMDWLPMAAPYALLDRPRVLLVNLGGGISAQVARYKGAASITIAERDPEVARLLGNDPAVSAFTGQLLKDPLIHLVPGEPRAHSSSRPGVYDLVEISLVDSVGLSDPGGYAVTENYTWTVEALRSYLGSLAPGGLLSITVWDRLDPPRNVVRLLATLVEALHGQGVADPGNRLFVFNLYQSTATMLVKNGDFSPGQIYDLRKFCDRRSFEIVWYPGIPRREVDFDAVMNTYWNHFTGTTSPAGNAVFTTSDVYHLALQKMLSGRAEDLYHAYPFDVRPMSDDRPYYTGFLRLDHLSMYLGRMRDVSEEWGELLILGILLQAIVFGLIIILLPLFGRWRDLFHHRRGVPGVITYYAALGLGYMMVEIFLMQRLVFFLGDPVYSAAIVLSTLLVLSALGNLAAPRISSSRSFVVRIAACVIVASMAFYIFGLHAVFDRFLASPMFVRVLLSVIIIAPAAFFMGMPFPTGLEALTQRRPRLLPWAWGMNGGLSVAGAALAQVAAVAGGFPVVLTIVAFLYVLVAILFPVNEFADSETGGVEPSAA